MSQAGPAGSREPGRTSVVLSRADAAFTGALVCPIPGWVLGPGPLTNGSMSHSHPPWCQRRVLRLCWGERYRTKPF